MTGSASRGRGAGRGTGKGAGGGAGKSAGKGSGRATGRGAGKATGKRTGGTAGSTSGRGAGPGFGPGRRPGRPAPSRAMIAAAAAADVHDPDGVRLQKVLAQAGFGSRRACEEMILAGRVQVDGAPVLELGVRIDPARAVLHVDGLRVQLDSSLLTLALNKPVGVISAMSDPQGRPSLAQLLPNRPERLFHVGRLDADTEGLILLTNDGELGNRLSHPRYQVPKVYLAEVAVSGGAVPRDLGRRLMAGIELDDGLATVDAFKVTDVRPGAALLELTLHDGRNRIVRRLLEATGHPVLQLVRTQIGPIRLGDLRTGRTRVIGGAELGSLMSAVGL